jgi:hypothetical protein
LFIKADKIQDSQVWFVCTRTFFKALFQDFLFALLCMHVCMYVCR